MAALPPAAAGEDIPAGFNSSPAAVEDGTVSFPNGGVKGDGLRDGELDSVVGGGGDGELGEGKASYADVDEKAPVLVDETESYVAGDEKAKVDDHRVAREEEEVGGAVEKGGGKDDEKDFDTAEDDAELASNVENSIRAYPGIDNSEAGREAVVEVVPEKGDVVVEEERIEDAFVFDGKKTGGEGEAEVGKQDRDDAGKLLVEGLDQQSIIDDEVLPLANEDVRENEERHENGQLDKEKSEATLLVLSPEKEAEVIVADNDEDGGASDGAIDEEPGREEAINDDDCNAASDETAKFEPLGSPSTVNAILKESDEGSSSVSTHSGSANSREFIRSMDEQIVAYDEDEEEDDEDGDDKEVFDSAALAALLKAATGSSQDGNINITSQDGTRVFTIDRPAGLGSSVPSLRPAAARPARSNLFSESDLAVTSEASEEMTEEEKKMHEKVESIRVKFLRLVSRLGHSPEETVAAQVLYRLSLAEGIRRGRQTSRAFSLESASKKASQLEAEGNDDLNFSCTILVLGKTGVGKSATINSIFGEGKSRTDAFDAATTHVREIVGIVDGVQIRIIDTPGLRPSVMDQPANKKILAAVKKVTKKCPPDIVLYVDRIDSRTRDLNDLPLLRTVTSTLGSSIWFNAIVALTHAASAPPDAPNGSPMTYENFVTQRSHYLQQLVRQAAGDLRLMNPVALVENHPSCRKNREGQKVLPNGLSWRQQLLLLCYSSKILSEANSLLKLQDSTPPGKLFGFRLRSPPLPFLLSSLLQSRTHPKLASSQGGDNGDSDIEIDDFSDAEQEDEEDEYDQLPPFKPLKKAQLAKLEHDQRKAYFEEYDYRVKLLQKKQWREEIRRLKELKKKGKVEPDPYAYSDLPDEYDQDGAPAAVPVPMPDMVLPPSFDSESPTYRYRFLEPASSLLARPVLDSHGWDHDCGYDGVSLEESLAIVNRFPAALSVQVTKDKKDFNIHLESAASAKHGDNGSSLAGFDIQTVGRQLAYIIRGETKFKNLKRNRTTGGFSVTFLGETVATGLKVEDQVVLGKRLVLVASTGAVRAQGDTAYGANLEARLRDKDYPIGQSLSTLGLSLMKWRGDLALGANLQSQIPIGRNSKMALRLGLNNKLSGQVSVKTSSSEHLQIALMGFIPVVASIYRMIRPRESFEY